MFLKLKYSISFYLLILSLQHAKVFKRLIFIILRVNSSLNLPFTVDYSSYEKVYLKLFNGEKVGNLYFMIILTPDLTLIKGHRLQIFINIPILLVLLGDILQFSVDLFMLTGRFIFYMKMFYFQSFCSLFCYYRDLYAPNHDWNNRGISSKLQFSFNTTIASRDFILTEQLIDA